MRLMFFAKHRPRPWSTYSTIFACNDHYSDVMMSTMASQITSLTIIYPTVHSGADRRKQQSSVSRAFFRGIHRWRGITRTKGPVTRKMIPLDDVIMRYSRYYYRAWNCVPAASVGAWYDYSLLICPVRIINTGHILRANIDMASVGMWDL